MFEQHPVPQNIASYQFRLVGDMTLTQFFQLAGGALVALLIYSLPLPAIFKWPLIAISVIGGAALAFLPIQERPLAMWIGAFMRSIYSPTFYIWRKLDSYQFFIPEEQAGANANQLTQDPSLTNTTIKPSHVTNLEEGEKTMLGKITSMFSFPKAQPKPQTQPAQPATGLLETPINITQTPQPSMPTVAPQTSKQVVVPRQQAVKVESQQDSKPQEIFREPIKVTEEKLNQTLSEKPQTEPGKEASFSVSAAPPSPPERSNIIVGQVSDSTGKIIEGTILEIKDEQGRPVRALKTNNAGHFSIVTPLNNGKYTIITEKDGYQFDHLNIEVTGQKIEPIAIHAK